MREYFWGGEGGSGHSNSRAQFLAEGKIIKTLPLSIYATALLPAKTASAMQQHPHIPACTHHSPFNATTHKNNTYRQSLSITFSIAYNHFLFHTICIHLFVSGSYLGN